jgi:DNA-binding HxlR family transcriptional regulator
VHPLDGLLLREMLAGSTRFNDLRRGVPRMSPALLSRRLKELQAADIVERRRVGGDDLHEYHLTRSGRELEPIVAAFGVGGQRWVESEVTLEKLDVQLLMWDMRRNLDTRPMPKRRSTIEFLFSGVQQNQSQWWLIVTPGEAIELCSVDPGFDVDLYIACDLRTMTAIWMGLDSVRAALRDDRVKLTGDKTLASNMQQWLGLSPFAKERKMVA